MREFVQENVAQFARGEFFRQPARQQQAQAQQAGEGRTVHGVGFKQFNFSRHAKFAAAVGEQFKQVRIGGGGAAR